MKSPKKKRILIVNADDCNLTKGVTDAILACHDTGIVSSTTFMINLPVAQKTVRSLLRRRKLGIGLHLNITLGKPVAASSRVRSLVDQEGCFFRLTSADRVPKIQPSQISLEYEHQITRFRKVFGRLPTHLDTHHQTHDRPIFLKVLRHFTKKYRLPIRRSRLMKKRTKVMTTDHCFGDLHPDKFWKKEKLEKILRDLPEGVNEIVCHPGWVDKNLRAISSFTTGRGKERRLFGSDEMKRWIVRHGIQLSHYGLCYT